jgi:hypothetical protein
MLLTNRRIDFLLIILICILLFQSSAGTNINIDLQTKIDTFSQIGTVYFSEKFTDIMYVSAQWSSDSSKSVKKYNISGNQIVLLQIFFNPLQSIIYDEVLEMDNLYIAFYKKSSIYIDIYYANSTLKSPGTTPVTVEKIVYSSLHQEVYILVTSCSLYYNIASDF